MSSIIQYLRWLVHPQHLLIVLLACVPPVLLFRHVAQVAVDAPFLDDWETSLDLALAVQRGTVSPQHFFATVGLQIVTFTQFGVALTTLLGGGRYHPLLELWLFTPLLGTLIALLAFRLLWFAMGKAALITLLPISALVFTFRASHVWMSAFNNQYLFAVVFALACMVILLTARQRTRTIVFGALCAACAAFSFSTGMVTWAILLVMMFMRGYRRPRDYALVIGLAALNAALFLWIIVTDSTPEPPSAAIDLVLYVHYWLLYLAGALANFNAPFLFGYAMALTALSLFVWMLVHHWRKGERVTLAPFVGMALFSLTAAFMTSLGRAELMLTVGPFQPLSDRYVIHSTPFWIGFVGLGLLTLLRATTPADKLLSALVSMALAAAVMFNLNGQFVSRSNSPIIPVNTDACVDQWAVFETVHDECRLWSTAEWHIERSREYIAARFGVFDAPAISIQLTFGPLTVTGNPFGSSAGFQYADVDGRSVMALVQSAPTTAQQTIHLPRGFTSARLETGLYVRFEGDLRELEDGVRATLTVRSQTTGEQISLRADYDPRTTQAIMPLMLDLTPLIGQDVTVQYAADPLVSSAYDTLIWVEPTLVLAD